MRASLRLRGLTAAVALGVAVLAAAAPASAAGRPADPGGRGGGGGAPTSTDGYDISYPQCGARLPKGAAFGVVGVNAGLVYSANPCLGTGDGPSELAWANATGQPQFYANTADPGPAYSSYWDVDEWGSSPEPCTIDDPDSVGCSYDYGWYAAADSFHAAVVAEQQVDASTLSEAVGDAAAAPWWLDVETGNSWESLEDAHTVDAPHLAVAYRNDTAALEGAVGYLRSRGITQVGFYSTSRDWDQITGGVQLLDYPSWVAGFTSASGAAAGCAAAGFSGGTVLMTQYPLEGYDGDHAC
ncbi:MAG TPA: hypothetical protein VFJ09_15685 [Nocardioidaceae bacterium]|nr:hypothetical protein [Nocardioidaceae bacterium]